MILISELLRKKLNIETPTGDREQEIITRFPTFLFNKGAYSSPTLARASYPFVYLPDRNTSLHELFSFDKSEKWRHPTMKQ